MQWDIVFIGGGMATRGALRAKRLGLSVAIVERDRLGGACLHWGCVPGKSLLKSAEVFKQLALATEFGLHAARPVLDFDDVQSRRKKIQQLLLDDLQEQLTRQGIDVLQGEGSLVEPGQIRVRRNGVDTLHSASAVVLATGSRPRRLANVQPDGVHILTSDDAIALPEVPESICIVGAGATGCEFASFYAALGSRVTLLEEQGTLLPRLDRDLGSELASRFHALKIDTHVAVEISSTKRLADGIELQFQAKGQFHTVIAEKILLAAGRVPNSEKLGLEKAGIKMDAGGFVEVNEELQTRVPNVYALGDLTGRSMLAHVAAMEAVHVTDRIAGRAASPLAYNAIPQVIETFPQIATVGRSEEEARIEYGAGIHVFRIGFDTNARALIEGDPSGKLKLVFSPDARLIGAHLTGQGVGDLMPVFSFAIQRKFAAAELREVVHPYLSRLDILAELPDFS